MAGTILFHRGTSAATLPEKKDGSIYIIASDLIHQEQDVNGITQSEYYGDMYVDISDTERLHIKPGDVSYILSKGDITGNGELAEQKPKQGKIYFIYNNETAINVNNETNFIPGIIVGDGQTSFKDLPVYTVVTDETADNIKSKVHVEAEFIGEDNYRIKFLEG